MKGKFAVVLTILSLSAQLSSDSTLFCRGHQYDREHAATADYEFGVRVAFTRSRLFSPVVADGKTLGALLIYDDPRTKRPDDYIELYDNGAHLVAVEWYDQFGIQRFAVDRGLLEPGYALSGIFVTLLSGDAI